VKGGFKLMERDDLVEKVNLMVGQVRSDGFKRVAGRAVFLKQAESLLSFVGNHTSDEDLNSLMFKQIKFWFDALVKRTQIYEKEN
jgi:hypothetical protein